MIIIFNDFLNHALRARELHFFEIHGSLTNFSKI